MGGSAPDLDDANHIHRSGLATIIWACFGTASLFVTSRIAFRIYNYGQIKLDDAWILLAWACMLVMCILEELQQGSLWYTAGVVAGHVDADEPTLHAQLNDLARWQFVSINLFWLSLWSVKASLLTLFYHVVSPFKTRRILWFVVSGVVILSLVGAVVSNAVSCHTPSDYLHSGHCATSLDLYRQRFNVIFSTVLDIFTDILIVCLPLSILPLLNLDVKKKIAVGFVFTLSLLIVAVSIARMTQIIVDTTVDLVGLTIWSTVETCIALIVGSLLPFSGLLSQKVQQMKTLKPSRAAAVENDFDPAKAYAMTTRSVTTTRIEPTPAGEVVRRAQMDGGIHVQRTFVSYIEEWVEPDGLATSSDDGSGITMVKSENDMEFLTSAL